MWVHPLISNLTRFLQTRFNPFAVSIKVALPVCTHVTTLKGLNGFLWNLIFLSFTKTCRHGKNRLSSKLGNYRPNGHFKHRPTCVPALLSDWAGNSRMGNPQLENYRLFPKINGQLSNSSERAGIMTYVHFPACFSCRRHQPVDLNIS
jgi:hypothetical protein